MPHVAFATNNDLQAITENISPGDTTIARAAFNGFQRPTHENFQPSALSLLDAVMIFWRIRTWTVTAIVPWAGAGGDTGPFTLESTNSDDSTIITSEFQLMRHPGYWSVGGSNNRNMSIMLGTDNTAEFVAIFYEDEGQVEATDDYDEGIDLYKPDLSSHYHAVPATFWDYSG